MVSTKLKDTLLIGLIVSIFFGLTLGRYPLAAPDSARYAEIPREMVVSGDYITPHLNGVKYFEKPPLFYWMQALAIKLFGANEVSVSIVNALMTLGTILLVYLASYSFYGRLAGILGAMVYATCALVFALTRVITLDVTLTFFLTGMLTMFLLAIEEALDKRRRLFLSASYFFMGCAVMTKGLVGLIFPGIIFILWLSINGDWRNLRNYYLADGIFIFLLVTLPWHILVQIKNPEFFRFYFIEQHFLRYFTSYAQRGQGWWFLPTLLLVGFYPWTVFLPQALFSSIEGRRKHPHAKQTFLLLLWSVTIYIFYTFSNSKLIPYILPIYPSLAILMGRYGAKVYYDKKASSTSRGFYILAMLNIILAMAAIIAAFLLNFEKYVFSRGNLVVVAALMLGSGLLIFYYARTRGIALGLLTTVVMTAATWFYLSPKITTINGQSAKPLITVLKKYLGAGDEVVCYGNYFQDVPFYLERIVTVANFTGELEFGTKYQDTKSWMIDDNTFQARWLEKRPLYLLIKQGCYDALVTSSKMGVGKVLAKSQNILLVTNGYESN